MAANEEKPHVRKWRCAAKNGEVQIWERVNSDFKQRQFRFGPMSKYRITTVVTQEKDIIEDKYEGGYTVWHGSLHALSYFAHLREHELTPLKNKRTMEIGCGNGVLGIFAAKYLDSFEVFFQDLNKEVLQWCTQPNLSLNDINPPINGKYLDGPWQTCFDLIPLNTFSLILTSDTVYRTKNFELLHRAFDHLLDHEPESQIYVSGKSVYFGNDGGILAFQDFVRQKGIFASKVVSKDDESVPHTLLSLNRIKLLPMKR